MKRKMFKLRQNIKLKKGVETDISEWCQDEIGKHINCVTTDTIRGIKHTVYLDVDDKGKIYISKITVTSVDRDGVFYCD